MQNDSSQQTECWSFEYADRSKDPRRPFQSYRAGNVGPKHSFDEDDFRSCPSSVAGHSDQGSWYSLSLHAQLKSGTQDPRRLLSRIESYRVPQAFLQLLSNLPNLRGQWLGSSAPIVGKASPGKSISKGTYPVVSHATSVPILNRC